MGYAFEEDTNNNVVPSYAFGPSCNLRQDLTTLRKKVDVLIVSCHWGLEFMPQPSPNTIALGRNLVDWGADIVLGHHPHVLQGFEHYNDGIILYSMGNFLFDMMWDDSFRESAIFVFTIEGKNIQLKTIPVVISNDYVLYFPNDEKGKIIQNKIDELNRKIILTIEGDFERKTLDYYLEYEAFRKKNRYRSYAYFLKNIPNVRSRFISQIMTRTLKRRFEEVGRFLKYNE